MTVEYQKVWTTMNDLEMVTSKICSAREIIDNAVDKIQGNEYDKAELLMTAAYEFLEYYLQEFDDKFKLAWQATVGDLRDGDKEAYDTVMKEREYYGEKSWNSFRESYYPEEYKVSTVSNVQYTEEELNAMCDKAEQEEKHSEHYYDYTRNDPNRENPFKNQNGVTYREYVNAKINAESHWNDGWTKEHYRKIVDKYEGKKTLNHDEAIAAGWTMTDDGFWIPPQKENIQTRWILPVQQCEEDYYVSFPQDLLEAVNLKEGDAVHWIDNNDGSYTIRKSIKTLASDEC